MENSADLDVAYVSRLVRLNLSEDETRLFQTQLAEILQYADKLREIDVTDVDPTAHGVPVFNVFREDEPRDWLTAEEALRNAPLQANGLFVVTKVVE